MGWTPGEIIVGGLLGLLIIYLVVRLASAAFFKSKQQYDAQRKNHG